MDEAAVQGSSKDSREVGWWRAVVERQPDLQASDGSNMSGGHGAGRGRFPAMITISCEASKP